MNLKEIGKVFTRKFGGARPSSYKKKKNLPGRGPTEVEKHWSRARNKITVSSMVSVLQNLFSLYIIIISDLSVSIEFPSIHAVLMM